MTSNGRYLVTINMGASAAPAEKVVGEEKKRREEGRAGRENMIRAKEEKLGASVRAIYVCITRVGRKREKREEKEIHTFSSLRVDVSAPGLPERFSAFWVSQGECKIYRISRIRVSL